MPTHVNRPRMAALSLACSIRHLFPDPHHGEWRLCLPLAVAEILEKDPPKTWSEFSKRKPSAVVEALMSRIGDLKELRKSLRRCRKLANEVRLSGTRGKEYSVLLLQLLRVWC